MTSLNSIPATVVLSESELESLRRLARRVATINGDYADDRTIDVMIFEARWRAAETYDETQPYLPYLRATLRRIFPRRRTNPSFAELMEARRYCQKEQRDLPVSFELFADRINRRRLLRFEQEILAAVDAAKSLAAGGVEFPEKFAPAVRKPTLEAVLEWLGSRAAGSKPDAEEIAELARRLLRLARWSGGAVKPAEVEAAHESHLRVVHAVVEIVDDRDRFGIFEQVALKRWLESLSRRQRNVMCLYAEQRSWSEIAVADLRIEAEQGFGWNDVRSDEVRR